MTLNIFLFFFFLAGLATFMATRLFQRKGREERLVRSDEIIKETLSAFLRQIATLRVFLWRKIREFWPVILETVVIALSFVVRAGKSLWREIKSRGTGEKRGSVSFYLKSVSEYKRDRDN